MTDATIHHLTFGKIAAQISTMGAECIALKKNGLEYLWQANPDIWGRHAPVLFPIVGKLKDNKYTYQGKSYTMGQHGFARDRNFELTEKTDHQLTMVLKADEISKKVYPFDFELSIQYSLSENGLNVDYHVHNPSEEKTLFFSIGAHPGFGCPLEPEKESFSDYQLDFAHENLTSLPLYTLEGGLISTKKSTLALQEGKVDLDYKLFENDALIMDVGPVTAVSVSSRKTGKGFAMQFSDFKWLGIWTKEKEANFICLEPWNGIAATTDHDGSLENKLGIVELAPQANHKAGFQVALLG
ncbi:aldose 1-epimerase family protein [Cyclobacterium qasimii]|uniref:Galactose mutarotase related enzyme n=2 Tax=Cyclobacterium qasimii TaxID=1350429 RepID=S7WWN3_9BACT|nr:aldose 1-epimerase family protein [Cyclobacterium qasimii]EPR71164.1 Galactose mutarotase related enzyme [Cyclobacterium qasimii M12-11B]GEO20685.1 aldose 1-epimerase [Cyclobacterium qasimii]